MPGRPRETRGHHHNATTRQRHVTALGEREEQRHWVSLAILGVAVVAAAGSAYAQYEQSQQQAKMAEYSGKIERNKAEAARQSAAIASENQRDEDRRIMAAQRARIGQAGVLGDVGSPLLAQMEAAETAALNEARIAWSGDTQASGHFAAEMGLRYQAKTGRRMGYLNSGVTLMSGLTKAYGAYKAP
ncbi:MAG TPA: hypothetical protein VML54_16215, partial [Candidatus Limnocylindrales bacterium]|nr:hypothetical protein [Candidatus Limnocylindrales bacterium]